MQNEPTEPSDGAGAAPNSRADGTNPRACNDAAGGVDALLPRQLMAIDMLFAGYNFVQVCAALRVDSKTLYRWRRLPAFAAEVRRRYAAHLVARQPPRRRNEGLIPPAPSSTLAAKVVAAERVQSGVRDDAYWQAVTADPNGELPPPSDDEPLWVREIRRIDASLADRRRSGGTSCA